MINYDPIKALHAAVEAKAEQILGEAATLHRIGFTWNELAILNTSTRQQPNSRFSYPQVILKVMMRGPN